MKSCIKKGCGCLLVSCATIALIVLAVTHLLQPKWHNEYGERFQDVAYGNRPGNTYDLYLPTDAAAKDSLALVLYVHGGSWLGGDKKEHHGDCYTLVKKGYATATMNYSLLNEEGVSLTTMHDEIGRCIAHIISFAAEKGAHISQMAIAGTSAGGHLAMMYAYNHPHQLPLRFEAIKVGPADFRILFPYNGKATTKDVENFVFSCTGNHIDAKGMTPEQIDSIKLLASPIHYINDSTALPAIFAYGGKDNLITSGHHRALKAKYDSLGKPYDLIVFPNSGHTLMSDKDCTNRYDSLLSVYCKRYFNY